MFGKTFISNAIDRSAENPADRRRFLAAAGVAGAGIAGGAYLTANRSASAQTSDDAAAGPSDPAILNFALNLEYLEAEFYLYAVTGKGLADSLTTGKGARGGVTGGKAVPFQSKAVRQYAREIADDELAHVKFLRGALGTAAVSRPAINLKESFTAAAMAAGLITAGQAFDPFKDEDSFLLGAYIFEDVGVTAYKGAAPLISNKTFLEAAAGILAVEAYHASNIRTTLYARELAAPTIKISDARDSLDGESDLDQGIVRNGRGNIVPADANGIAFSRGADQVLNIVYLTPNKTTKGGFFPNGVNGEINTSRGIAA
ncbi:MAG: ferritin-like domain-containing protein [Mycobacteriales bacterium]